MFGLPGVSAPAPKTCKPRTSTGYTALHKAVASDIKLDAWVASHQPLHMLAEFPEVMEKLANKAMDAEAMITHRLPFTDFLNAFEVADDAAHAAKVVLTF